MKRKLQSLVVALSCCVPFAEGMAQQAKKIGDFIESTSYNDHLRGSERRLQYRPDGMDFVCVNGMNRFTRSLYGSTSPFRLETSDRPVFAAYDKKNSKNIRLQIKVGQRMLSLDSLQYCEARYTAGRRSYVLKDPAFGNGIIRIAVLALPDKDGAVWEIRSDNLPENAILQCLVSEIRAAKLHRNGDMGADPPGCFEAPEHPKQLQAYSYALRGTSYLVLENLNVHFASQAEGQALFERAEVWRQSVSARLQINTPDPYLNTLGGTLAVAADGIWDGTTWLHGAVGWRMQLPGWRAAYAGDALGWHERARKHFDAYAASQVTDVPNTIPHPAQDSVLHLARAVKKWHTPMYSNGYICRNPNRNNQMHHYDMNLCYMDELMWHFNWTGDVAYMRKMWPVITRHLEWEKRNFDPDNDGLYDAYACIWASDALYYDSGAVTHSSAYNYRANKMAALIAEKIGVDASPYRKEADRILKAMNEQLWIPEQGHWAEFQDFMGRKKLHEGAAVWTIYHAIDSETADPFQAYQATRYVDTSIPHIPVMGKGLVETGYETVATTNWLPYSWSINNVAFAEVYHTALAYFQAGRGEDGLRLLKGSILDGMYLGNSPGNVGQISFYDAARGECYRDFGDPIGILSRTLVQGLYGILPDALNGKLVVRPGFPADWHHASIAMKDVSYNFRREGNRDVYHVRQSFSQSLALTLQLNGRSDTINSVTVNGSPVKFTFAGAANGYPVVQVENITDSIADITIEWGGQSLKQFAGNGRIENGNYTLAAPDGVTIIKVYDPQTLFVSNIIKNGMLKGTFNQHLEGAHTFFLLVKQGQMQWWQPVNVTLPEREKQRATAFDDVQPDLCRTVDISHYWNASVSDIFRNQYLSPRSPYTTLELPTQGIGEWCHPLLTATVDDSGLRNLVKKDVFKTSLGIPFRTPETGKNILFTSLWDNYPDQAVVPLSGRASHAYLLLAGSTNHMQSRFVNGVVYIDYADGTSEKVELVNPDNWCPIEQDFFVDGKAFSVPSPRPYRLHFKTGIVSRDLGEALGIHGVYGREIEGGAGVLLDVPLHRSKRLKSLRLETVANDVVIGLMSVTLQR